MQCAGFVVSRVSSFGPLKLMRGDADVLRAMQIWQKRRNASLVLFLLSIVITRGSQADVELLPQRQRERNQARCAECPRSHSLASETREDSRLVVRSIDRRCRQYLPRIPEYTTCESIDSYTIFANPKAEPDSLDRNRFEGWSSKTLSSVS